MQARTRNSRRIASIALALLIALPVVPDDRLPLTDPHTRILNALPEIFAVTPSSDNKLAVWGEP